VCGFLALVDAKGNFWKTVLAGAYLGLAAATRISAGAVGPVVACVLLCGAWRKGSTQNDTSRNAWLGLALGWGLALGAVLLPFWWRAPEAFQFGMFEYHTAREAGGLFKGLVYKAGFLARVLRAYLVPVSIACIAACFSYRQRKLEKPKQQQDSWSGLVLNALWLSVVAVTLVHLSAPFPYDDYEVIVAPLFCIGTAVLVAGLFANRRDQQERAALAVAVLCLAGCLASPMLEGWFIGDRDRIWWPVKQETSLENLKRAAERVKLLAGKNTSLLTQDLYLAIESGMSVPAGLEMGPFSYFPDLTDDKARQCHVLNRGGMATLLANSGASVSAWSDYGLAIQCPSVTPIPEGERMAFLELLSRRYDTAEVIAHFGQVGTPLRILTKKTEDSRREPE
jgi:4-amino-4-deoxy-L-arabinose transferase-like glycosyltransferase